MSSDDNVTAVPSASPSMADVATYSPSAHPTQWVDPGNEPSEHQAAANTVILVGVMFLCVMASYFLRQSRKIRNFVPESAASMLIGVVAGSIASGVMPREDLGFLQFQPQVFFFILLPPIVFDAGFSIKKRLFFDNLPSILLFAVFGTIISTFVIGILTFGAARANMIHIDASTPLQSLLFGALISSVDPVATLSIMGDPSVGVDPLLYSLVFGESVLNDAVAIVLFRVFFDESEAGQDFEWNQLGVVMGHFFTVAIGSLFLGAFIGLAFSFGFKNASQLQKYPVMEVQLIFIAAFGSFALGEWLNMSGVTSLFTTGLTLSHYNFFNLSEESKISSLYVFETMAKTAETLVFVSIGLSLFATPMDWDAGFFFLAWLFCLIGRALNIFPLAIIANLCRREKKIPRNAMILMFFSGLRGSVSVALAMQLDASAPGVSVIRSTTLLIVIVTTLVLGCTAYKVIDALGMRAALSDGAGGLDGSGDGHGGNGEHELRENFASYLDMNSHALQQQQSNDDGLEGYGGETHHHQNQQQSSSRLRVTRFWHRLDDMYMKPLFGGSTETNARRARRTAAALHNDPDAGAFDGDALWPSDTRASSHLETNGNDSDPR